MNTLATMPLTESEQEWIETLRMMTDDRVPAPTLRTVQALRLGFSSSEFVCPGRADAKCSHATSTTQNALR